jgi:hypothetical protein
LAWVVFEKCGAARVVEAQRVTTGQETPQALWITKKGKVIDTPAEWGLFCASEGTARGPEKGGGPRVMGGSADGVDAGEWRETRAMGARIGQELRRQAVAGGEDPSGALAIVYAIFADALLLRPKKGEIEGAGTGARAAGGDEDAIQRVGSGDDSAAGTSVELREGLMGSDRSEGSTGADDAGSGEDESYAALVGGGRSESSGSDGGGSGSSDGGDSGDEGGGGELGGESKARAPRRGAPETTAWRKQRGSSAARGATGARGSPRSRGRQAAGEKGSTAEKLTKALLRAASTASTQEMVGGVIRAVAHGRFDEGVAKAVHGAGGHGTLNTASTSKGVARAKKAQGLGRLCQDEHGGYDEIKDCGVARFVDKMTGQFQCGGSDMTRVLSGDAKIGSTDLVKALTFRTIGSGADGKLAVGNGIRDFLELIVDATVAAQGGGAKGEATEAGSKGEHQGDNWHLGRTPSHHDSGALSPLQPTIVGHRAADLAGAMIGDTVGLAELGVMLGDAQDIFTILFGARSPIPVAAGRQRAALESLVYGDPGAYNGVGVAGAFHACGESLGGIVVAACIDSGDAPLIDGVDSEGINPIAREAMECVRQTRRLERAARGAGGVGSASAKVEGAPVREGHGPRRPGVPGADFGGYRSGMRKVLLRPANLVEVDEYQREITAALVGAGEPRGITRRASPGEAVETPAGRRIRTGLGCPFFAAGRCVAGVECTLSHRPLNGKGYAWPTAGALAPLQELYGIHIGFCAAP